MESVALSIYMACVWLPYPTLCIPIIPCQVFMLMSVSYPTSRLSFSNSSDGSVDHEDDVSPPYPPQPGIPPVLDGSRPHHYGQPLNYKSSSQASSNLEWEVTVVLKCPLLSQNFALNFEKVSLQGTFP